MSDADHLARVEGLPATVGSLTADLRALGVRDGGVLMVHASLSSMAWVVGGAPAVVAALTAALGPDGTLVMPTHSGDLSDPAGWTAPPVPPAWHDTIRTHMPAYDPATTPTRIMGTIAESFRTHPGVLRSDHPRQSCAARGRHAAIVVADHPVDCAMGERSPLARVYDFDGQVLLLGVGHANNSALHLAEYRAAWPGKRTIPFGSPATIDGKRRWLVVDDLDFDDSDFALVGADFERDSGLVAVGPVARATARLMPQRALVDYAADWMARHRGTAA